MSGLLIAALGLALTTWHIRARAGRISLHPRLLKTPAGSAVVFCLGAGIVAWGGILTVASWGNDGIFLLILLGSAFVVILLAGLARSALASELRAAYERHRQVYPELDDEALFRFIVKDRHPEWNNDRIQALTEDCASLEDLSFRLRGEEN